MGALLVLLAFGCSSGASDTADARLGAPSDLPDASVDEPGAEQEREAVGEWRIPFADDDGEIVTRVSPRETGTVEFEASGPVEIVVVVETDVGAGLGASGNVSLRWAPGVQPLASPVVEDQGPRDCSVSPALSEDPWTRGPLLMAGVNAGAPGRYVLELEHRCDEEVTFTVRPATAERSPSAVVGSWSFGWLPDDAGSGEIYFAPVWLTVADDGTIQHCQLWEGGDVPFESEQRTLQWEPRGRGQIALRTSAGETVEPELWLVDGSLALVDTEEQPFLNWLRSEVSNNEAASSSIGWTAGWADILISRTADERPEVCAP